MNAQLQASADPRARPRGHDWAGIADELDAHGCAMLEALLPPPECMTLAGMYADDERLRSCFVLTEQHPLQGTRGSYRVNLRHDVSRVRGGRRHTLGIIFHDAA